MTPTVTSIDATILSRVIDPEEANLSSEAAQGLLSLAFRDEDQQRMHELAEKARQGTLTPEEQELADSYERVGSLLGLLQSKARLSLKKTNSGS